MKSYARITIRLETVTPQLPDDNGYQRTDHVTRVSEIILNADDEATAVRMVASHIGVMSDFYPETPVREHPA